MTTELESLVALSREPGDRALHDCVVRPPGRYFVRYDVCPLAPLRASIGRGYDFLAMRSVPNRAKLRQKILVILLEALPHQVVHVLANQNRRAVAFHVRQEAVQSLTARPGFVGEAFLRVDARFLIGEKLAEVLAREASRLKVHMPHTARLPMLVALGFRGTKMYDVFEAAGVLIERSVGAAKWLNNLGDEASFGRSLLARENILDFAFQEGHDDSVDHERHLRARAC